MTSLAAAAEAVFAAEREIGLLELCVDGAYPWERIRFDLHARLLEGAGLLDAPTARLPAGWAARARVIARRAFDAARRSPWRAPPAEMLFVGHPRRRRCADGTWWDVYCDPVLPLLGSRAVYAEEPDLTGHREPARTEAPLYLDALWLAGLAGDLCAPVRLPRECESALARADALLREATGAAVDSRRLARTALRRRRGALPLARRLLDRLRPRLVVVVVSYGKETLVEAAREREIPVVELQHGVIHPHHMGYAFPGAKKRAFPDWLLSFGEFWRCAAPYPIPPERVRSVGYPYFDAERAGQRGVRRGEQILFLSQRSIGAPLARLAVELARRQPRPVVFKLHPEEYRDWRTRYPGLAASGVRVIDSDAEPLYRLLAESSAQVGVYSTALYEGLGFGLDTFIAELPGADAMRRLVNAGRARRVADAAALAAALARAPEGQADVDAFFRPDAARRVVAELSRIAAGAPLSAAR